jgi:hypothetical protein
MKALVRSTALFLLCPAFALADISVRVPVVTQIQGAVFYRTSITGGNGNETLRPVIRMRLYYRSPVDGSFQSPTLALADPLLPHRTFFFEDIVQHFKNSGAIRAQDLNAAIFGTLVVTFEVFGMSTEDSIVEARTYSAAPGGGTLGIAYIGRDIRTAGSERVKTAVRNGTFGTDGTTRANIGFVNEGGGISDIEVSYYDGASGATLKQFILDDVAVGEVRQLNNIFADAAVPAGTRTIIVRGKSLAPNNGRVSGYAVQLDSVTNDGSFFLMAEEDDDCEYTPPN